MVTRSTRAAAKSTVVNAKAQAQDAKFTEAAHEVFADEQMSLKDKLSAYFTAAAEAYGASSVRAYICGRIAGFFVQCGAAYAIWSIVSSLSIAMLLVSGSMFISVVLAIIGLLITLVASGFAGSYVHHYIASGTASRHWNFLKDAACGVLGNKRDVAAC